MIQNQKAFTLIELLVVITIIGILLSILFTGWGYISQQQSSKKAKLEIVGLKNAVSEYFADFGEYPNCPEGVCTSGETLFLSLAGFHNEAGGLELPPYPSKIPTHLFHFEAFQGPIHSGRQWYLLQEHRRFDAVELLPFL